MNYDSMPLLFQRHEEIVFQLLSNKYNYCSTVVMDLVNIFWLSKFRKQATKKYEELLSNYEKCL